MILPNLANHEHGGDDRQEAKAAINDGICKSIGRIAACSVESCLVS